MAMAEIKLKPSVDTERTLAGNMSGISRSNFVRWKMDLAEKRGGCSLYIPNQLDGYVSAIKPWADIVNLENNPNISTPYVGVGTNTTVYAYRPLSLGDNLQLPELLLDISPEYIDSARVSPPTISTTAGSSQVTIVDPAVQYLTVYDSVTFNTQVSIGGLVLQGTYPLVAAGGVKTYIIETVGVATSSSSDPVLPTFVTNSGSNQVTVKFPIQYVTGNLNLGDRIGFKTPTSVGGITIVGQYIVSEILNPNAFVIIDDQVATFSDSKEMNNGALDVRYWITEGPTLIGSGYGANAYGEGPYGQGPQNVPAQGDKYSANKWWLDSRGSSLIASAVSGPMFFWNNDYGYKNLSILTNAPIASSGSFVSMPYGNVMAWGCSTTINPLQDPLFIRWSDSLDINNWSIAGNSSAGFYTMPTGSRVVRGIQGPTQQWWFTDIDVYSAQYIGYPGTFGFNKIGNNCGLIAPWAAAVLGSNVYWMSQRQFYTSTVGSAPQQLPCTVWDFVFQNLDLANVDNIVCGTNALFNEVNWFFPSTNNVDGVPDAYVSFNTLYNLWDYGYLERTAWYDQSLVGPPLAADSNGWVYQHETSYDLAVGQNVEPINAWIQTGYYSLTNGQDLTFVDWARPDFIWGQWDLPKTAELQITFFVTDYAGQDPRVLGPYKFNQQTKYICPRFRGRFVSMKIESNDLGSFWRIGSMRYRAAMAGRR